MIRASAPAKLILFGEHAVVYGEGAIATAIDKRAYVTATELEEKKIIVSSEAMGNVSVGYLKEKTDSPIIRAAQLSLKKLNKDTGVRIEINSEIPIQAGLGSSASVVTATSAAVLNLFSENETTNNDIVQFAHEAEKIAHGKPSGIDTAITTFGGTLFYQKGQAEALETGPLTLIIGNTGKRGSTKEIVAKVRSQVEDPRVAYSVFTIGSLVRDAKKALLANDVFKLGQLMNKNHEYLRDLGVSSDPLEKLVDAAKNAGAFGAKLTGAGGGGCMVALAEEPEDVVQALKDNGADAFVVRTNQEGVRVENDHRETEF